MGSAKLTKGPQTGTPPTLQQVAIDRLQIDAAYQRATDGPHSRRIIVGMVKEWKWNLCQPLAVSRRADGSLFVLDGQHRLTGARERGDIPYLPCVIVSDLDGKGEAKAFVDLNTRRQRLSQLDIFTGMLAAGDENAKATAALLEETGWRIVRSANTQGFKPGDLTCAPMLARQIKAKGTRVVRQALQNLRAAYPQTPVTSTANMLQALIRLAERRVGDARVVDCLSRKSPGLWIGEGADIAEIEGESRVNGIALAIERTIKGAPAIRQPSRPPMPATPAARPIVDVLPDEDGKTWCDQCDARVTPAAAKACNSRFCSLRKVA